MVQNAFASRGRGLSVSPSDTTRSSPAAHRPPGAGKTGELSETRLTCWLLRPGKQRQGRNSIVMGPCSCQTPNCQVTSSYAYYTEKEHALKGGIFPPRPIPGVS